MRRGSFFPVPSVVRRSFVVKFFVGDLLLGSKRIEAFFAFKTLAMDFCILLFTCRSAFVIFVGDLMQSVSQSCSQSYSHLVAPRTGPTRTQVTFARVSKRIEALIRCVHDCPCV